MKGTPTAPAKIRKPAPKDKIAEALREVREAFGRKPTREEIIATLDDEIKAWETGEKILQGKLDWGHVDLQDMLSIRNLHRAKEILAALPAKAFAAE